jgi:ribose transport system ATP-binding protein
VTPRLDLRGLSKTYAAPALRDASLVLEAGEVHALVGENGAGKSTLARIVAGLTAADAGHMRLDGIPYAPCSRREAVGRGVRMVLQELSVLPTLTVAENIFLAGLPHRFGVVDRTRLREDARRIMETLGLADIDPDAPAGALGIGRQQLVEIAAALVDAPRATPCRLLVLDEPTAALTRTETAHLFAHVRRLRATGTTIVYISHRLEELAEVADRVTVLRDGALVATAAASALAPRELVRLMVGRAVDETPRDRAAAHGGEIVLRAAGLTAPPAVLDVSFELRRGEILGLAGLMGAGRTETLRAIFAADERASGDIYLGGSSTPAVIRSPVDAVRHGLALVTEDRKAEGLLLPRPVRENVALASERRFGARSGIVWPADERRGAQAWIERLSIRCTGPEQPAAELSGGNQQKVLIARWLAKDPQVLMFDEPTRGIDVGARREIYRLLWTLADAGKSILVVSSDLHELMLLCDRIAVLSLGVLCATFERSRFDQETLLTAALSRHRALRPADVA